MSFTESIKLQPQHGYPILVALASGFVVVWAGFGVSAARKKYKIKYPQMYAEQSDPNATAFNCYQRAHQNVMENLPYFLVLLGTSAIHRPVAAAVAGLTRLAGFVAYVKGYQSGDPAKRMKGAFGYFGLLGMIVMTGELSVRLLLSD